MRIGFDVSQTGHGKAGCGFYAYGLIRALTECDDVNDYILYPTFGDHYYDPEIRCDEFAGLSNFKVGPHHDHTTAKNFWGHPSSALEEDIGNPDVVHANNFFAPTGLVRARLVYTVYDLGFLENWSWTTEINRTGCFEGLFRASVHADWLVAISGYSKERFIQMFPHYPPERITVVYPASRFDENTIKEEPSAIRLQRRKFWLCVGTIEPRKNYLAILAAYAKLRATLGSDVYPLVIAGGAGWMMDIDAAVRNLNLRTSVTLLGYTPDAVLHWLYRNATCLVFPSLYEGFGMPALEAMSCGTPVITAAGSAFPEVVGDTELSRFQVDPLDAVSIYDGMRVVHGMSTDQIDRLGSIAKRRADEFSWHRSAQSVLEVYKQAVAAPKLFGAHNGDRYSRSASNPDKASQISLA
jgi:glycosyltransferase involved in cell wall biosynthesis